MFLNYNPQKIEKKWQNEWEKQKLYQAKSSSKKEPYYALVEFPYPSGDGLHVGHVRSYTALDVVARKRRMEGKNVLYPIGWDAFGLPTEQYAIKNKIHPRVVTKKNTDNFRRQLQALGFSFDWSREINTSDPAYYKWTQWIFLQLFKEGLAYKAKTTINWCPNCKIGLANEEIEQGHCERCGGEVEEREKEQWMLKMTAYADSLLSGLDGVDYIEEIKTQQRHWIGKSEGAHITFILRATQKKEAAVDIFTTRPDTIYGATFLVLGPEHPILSDFKLQISNFREVEDYIKESRLKTNEERIAEKGEKTGVELKGVMAVNPATGEDIPVWVADYVLGTVGTGAIMAVPAHDARDFAFARKYWLDIVPVVAHDRANGDSADNIAERLRGFVAEEVYTGRGTLMHSGEFNGMDSEEAKWNITKKIGGSKKTNYRLRDWIFSRQRYWGEPIPLVFCAHCLRSRGNTKEADSKRKREKNYNAGEAANPGWIAVPEKDLPVVLPAVKNYEPRDDGQSPLASVEEWVSVACPACGNEARRETDTMPNWAGSSWYFLAYLMSKKAFKNNALRRNWKLEIRNFKHFMPVDWYNGGMEHATRHLLYSRFWNQFLYSQGLVPVSEPYAKRTAHGLILGSGGVKMSKSKGNVVNPDDLLRHFGADALRLYEMFIGPFDQAVSWDPRGIVGTRRFLERAWKFVRVPMRSGATKPDTKQYGSLEALVHKAVKKVSDDIEMLRMNTAISTLMTLLNKLEAAACGDKTRERACKKTFVQLMAPFAPHAAEELWAHLGGTKSVHCSPWPAYDADAVIEDKFQLVIQINGKVRATVDVSAGIAKEEAERLALSHDRVIKVLDGKTPKNIVFVPGRLVNIVT